MAALRELAASAGMAVEFSADPSLLRPGLLDPEREVDSYRIVQEALGNATHHAHADRIRISVTLVDRMLHIEVVDDGVGFDAADVRDGGLGLAGMRDRAEAARGALHVRSWRGTGTVVRLDVPLTDAMNATLARERVGVSARASVP